MTSFLFTSLQVCIANVLGFNPQKLDAYHIWRVLFTGIAESVKDFIHFFDGLVAVGRHKETGHSTNQFLQRSLKHR